MTISINGEEKRIGLALPGGGLRAAAYHLGTFRKLKELGLLDKIDLFSCVSGGSIASSINNVTPADVYFGRDKAILKQRERIKRKTLEARRLHHCQRAA